MNKNQEMFCEHFNRIESDIEPQLLWEHQHWPDGYCYRSARNGGAAMRTQVTVSGLCQFGREEAPPGAGEAEESRRQDGRQAAARAGSAVPGWHLRAEPRISPREGLAFHKTTHTQELPRILLALTAATSLLFCSWSSSGMGLLETKWWWETISVSQKSAPRIF